MTALDLYFFGKNLTSSRYMLLALTIFGVLMALSGIYMIYGKSTLNANMISVGDISNPQVTSNATSGDIYVDIGGAVVRPGIYKLKTGARLAELLEKSGGVQPETVEAHWFLKNINLAKTLFDEQKIYIPFEWEVYESTQTIANLEDFPIITNKNGEKVSQIVEEPDSDEAQKSSVSVNASITKSATSSPKTDTGATATENKPTAKLNVNSATAAELEELPGIGPTYAERIVQNRPYKDIGELQTKAKLTASVISKIQNAIFF